MGQPIVLDDQITGNCSIHMMPNPATGAPQPSAPLPFSAPLPTGLATTVTIGGKRGRRHGARRQQHAAARRAPPERPVHGPDRCRSGTIMTGSPTVLIEGKPAATHGSQATCCATPGHVVPTVATVSIG